MAQTKRSVTIIDVAKAANVSVSTVSRVINNKDDVSAATYRRVNEVIDELGYAQSLAARSMRSRQTGVIGLIMPDVDDPFSIEVMRGVNRAIIEESYDLLIYTNGEIRKNNSATWERQYVALLNSNVTDGVIIVTPMADQFSSVSPVVSIDPNRNNPTGPAVISTNYHGALAATEYLVELGHRRIGYIGGRADLLSAVRRQEGFEDALKAAQIPLQPDLVMPGDYSVETGQQQATELLSLDERPTAIFAANDQSAKGVLQATEALDVCVPDDLSVVGYDNIPDAAYLGLTTVDQHVNRMGYVGTQMLFQLIRGEKLQNLIHKINCELIVRGSCRAL
jgi:LacI family transcriptional regulator